MTDKQQIEEMAKIASINCGECYTCEFSHLKGKGLSCMDYLVANEFYNAGYRKIDENAVVLTREQHKQMFKDLIASNKVIEAETRKETAKEILQNLYYFSNGHSFRTEEMGDNVYLNKVDDILVFIEEEARKYKVEVET